MDADMSVRDVMSREFLGVSESDSVVSIVRLMLEEAVGFAVVLRGRDPVGTVTERDVLSLAVENGTIEKATVAETMSEAVPTVRSDRDLAVGIDRLVAADGSRLVVIGEAGPEPVGVLTYRDVATTIAHSLRSRNGYDAEDTPGTGASGFEAERAANESIQGICESCGTLSRSLSVVDGRSLCPNCRDV
jgi:CBS domain-containing protein